MNIQFYLIDVKINGLTLETLFLRDPHFADMPEKEHENHIIAGLREIYGDEIECTVVKDIGNVIVKEKHPVQYKMATSLILQASAKYN